ncbi:hypothetical protein EYB31_00935 [Paenibacillus thalictri]|uniref:Uncharacterized protein n=1 Tax=Paenibacillus thalictri TaxID=2527873 RepID=A0A4Q9DZE4_9BACL|nr:hypothetical protein EYB31_00935 [Paenibacillus thalictri]
MRRMIVELLVKQHVLICGTCPYNDGKRY